MALCCLIDFFCGVGAVLCEEEALDFAAGRAGAREQTPCEHRCISKGRRLIPAKFQAIVRPRGKGDAPSSMRRRQPAPRAALLGADGLKDRAAHQHFEERQLVRVLVQGCRTLQRCAPRPACALRVDVPTG